MSVERQSEEQGQDFAMNENQSKIHNRLDELAPEIQRKVQVRQVQLLKALTPWPYLQEKNAVISDLPIFPTNSTSDLPAEQPQILECIQTNSRYKDVPELICLFEKHRSHNDNYENEESISDGCALSSILKKMNIPGNP